MNRTHLAMVLVVALIGSSAMVFNVKAVEDEPISLISSVNLSPCANITGRFQVKTSQSTSSISDATKKLVANTLYYSKAIVVESLTLTKDSITHALDLAIESI